MYRGLPPIFSYAIDSQQIITATILWLLVKTILLASAERGREKERKRENLGKHKSGIWPWVMASPYLAPFPP